MSQWIPGCVSWPGQPSQLDVLPPDSPGTLCRLQGYYVEALDRKTSLFVPVMVDSPYAAADSATSLRPPFQLSWRGAGSNRMDDPPSMGWACVSAPFRRPITGASLHRAAGVHDRDIVGARAVPRGEPASGLTDGP